MSVAELSLTLRHAAHATIVAELKMRTLEGSEEEIIDDAVPVNFDEDELRRVANDSVEYGHALTRQLFDSPRMQAAWQKLIGYGWGSGATFRLRLHLESKLEGRHALRWETLHDPERKAPLCLGQHVLFSRSVRGGVPGIGRPPSRDKLRAVVAIAGPSDLRQYSFAALDVAAQLRVATDVLGELKPELLAGAAGHQPASLANLGRALRAGTTIVYLVCHGSIASGKPYLWLEQNEHAIERVEGEKLAEIIRNLPPDSRPSLIVLASCHSAGNDDPAAVAGAIGPLLARAGVRAVVAMQGLAPIPLLEHFMPTLFKEILTHGQIDRGIASARASLRESSELPWWMPVLYLRSADGRLWSRDGAEEGALQGPFQQPRAPEPYVQRTVMEQRLRKALTSTEARPIAILHGMSGAGKTSLATTLAHQFEADGTFAAVLWGSLDHLTPNDQLQQFLAALDPTWGQRQPTTSSNLRSQFWEHLAKLNRPVLIVCDQVADAQQLAELLPTDPTRIGRSRVLALSLRRLRMPGLEALLTQIELNGLTSDEANDLFKVMSSPGWAAQHEAALRAISYQLEHIPQLLTLAARDLFSGSLSPSSLLKRLVHERRTQQLLDASVSAVLEVAIRDLSAAQCALLEFVGILGEGDWNYRMLAAVARRAPEELRGDLDRLVERDLVRHVGGHRYSANTLVREFALERLRRLPDYVRVAAATLLARHCHDLVQDAFELAARRQQTETRTSDQSTINKVTVERFREQVRPELSHLRRALHWASEQQDWDLLRRFAYMPAFELLAYLVVNHAEMHMTLTMPTIVEPVTRTGQGPRSITYADCVVSADWSMSRPQSDSGEANQLVPRPDRSETAAQRRCEMIWNITAGHILDGVFMMTSLIDSSWKGVRAPRLVCRSVDIVGSELLACDLSQSVLFDCDARQVQLLGTLLQEALLVEVRLHGADLRGINASGAIFEKVDLRGADLRGASLIGATLSDVDLRGADLQGANLTKATLRRVKLEGALLQGATWAGAELDAASRVEDVAMQLVIDRACNEPLEPSKARVELRHRPAMVLPDPLTNEFNLADQDLRARRLSKYDLRNANLSRADLSAASLEGAILDGIDGERLRARGAILRGAELPRARLGAADLRAVDLSRAYLFGANLERAILRSALAPDADFTAANMRAADLRFANLTRADLQGADLAGADLRGAILAGAQLEDAVLSGANLSEANLKGARLHKANLRGAQGSHANFTGATIDERQLASIGALGGAILPDGRKVSLLRGAFQGVLPEIADTRYAQWSGNFVACTMRGMPLFGACLDGKFVACELDQAELECSHLTGIFASCNLTGARLAGARLTGIFYQVDLSGADLTGADLSGASFVNCLLVGAVVNDEQLGAAARLRGTQLTFGRYDGRFPLPGDLEDARSTGINLEDKEQLYSQFYALDSVRFKHI